MKKYLSNIGLLTACALLLVLPACKLTCITGSGNKISEDRKVSDFTAIRISGNFKVKLVQDSSLNLHITTDDNLLKYIKTRVEGDKLIVSNEDVCTNGDQEITIGVHNLNALHASGAVEVTSDGKINTGDMEIELSGSTKVTLDLNAARLTTKGSGSTEVNLKGQASTHNIDLSGSGNVNALDFIVGDYNISTSGSSDCQINVLRELNVRSSGSSSIKYRGTPTQINNSKSGSSSIEKIN
ncbi:MAG: head GIN domain-containing protein [Mucilaginibacter sp.]